MPAERRTSRPHHAQSGQALLEFALASLLLLTAFFGVLDLGRAVFTRAMFASAVREAARYGAISPADTTANKGAMAAAANTRSPTITLSGDMLTVTCSSWGGASRACNAANATSSNPAIRPLDRLQVCANYQFNLVAVQLIGRSTITFSECARTHVQ